MNVSRHTAYNLIGTLLPVLVALATIPYYIKLIGEERFGMLSIVWILLGYFGVFDLGIGRAAAQRIATLGEAHDAKNLSFYTALSLNSILGIIGGLMLWPAANYFFINKFQISVDLKPEVLQAIPWLILALPLATINGVLSGALQGVEKFLQLNSINATGSILFQTLPLIAAMFWSPNLGVIMPIAIFSRLLGVIFLFVACQRFVAIGRLPAFCVNEARILLRFGGWVTVSSLISPIMVIADRFIIGAIIGAKAVTQYTVPFQLAERTTILPSALSSSLFPKFAKISVRESEKIAVASIKTLLVVMTPIVALAILLSGHFLEFWISPEFSKSASLVLQILLIGFWINGLARVPHAKLLATGRPKVVAVCHLVEIIPYLFLLFLGLRFGGVEGAAIAFTLRVFVDFILLSVYANTLKMSITMTLVGISFLGLALMVGRQDAQLPHIVFSIILLMLICIWSVTQAPDIIRQRIKKLINYH